MDGWSEERKVSTMDSWSDSNIIMVFWYFMSSQNSIITLHKRCMIFVKGDGSIYRPRVGGMDGQDARVMRFWRRIKMHSKMGHMDCACLAPIGRWHLSQGGWVWEDRIWVGEGLNESGWVCKSHEWGWERCKRCVRVIYVGGWGENIFFDFGLG